jgi:hypothetical protein
MVAQAAHDSRFRAAEYGGFGASDGAFLPAWDIKYRYTLMSFHFAGGTTLMAHALYKANPAVRLTSYYDTAIQQWTNWSQLP